MPGHDIAPWAWIPIVLWAAFAQTIRNATQRTLVARVGTLAATLVRFLYGLPFALAWLVLVHLITASPWRLPPIDAAYLGWLLLGACAQLVATALLLTAMKQRNFIIGVTFSKTEVLQVGIFGTVMLQELPTLVSGVAMVVATIGVVLLSLPKKAGPGALAWNGSAAGFGLASGACFALSAVGYRGAALELAPTLPWLVGAWNVALAQGLQSLLLGGWIAWRQPGTLQAIAQAWRPSLLAGMMGALASIGWLTATALRPAADVRTLGLVEVFFSYLVSRQFFQERMSPREIAGLVLVLAGVLAAGASM
ncbi:MAG: DMT family transporter [Rhodoferax sp.]|jgi:drug/metabolite transporter (DMT)-like permease|nr:DMT family transporter [Rhodoferax sp.]